jgi:L-aminopeptidase/D-esterase-like protein
VADVAEAVAQAVAQALAEAVAQAVAEAVALAVAQAEAVMYHLNRSGYPPFVTTRKTNKLSV